MKQRSITFILVLLAMVCQAQTNSVIKDPKAFSTQVDALVKQYQDFDIFSGAVLVAEDNKSVYEKAFGLSNRDKGTPNTLNTLFDIGSINKLFTKVLVIQLIEEGRVKPIDPIGKFLKGFPQEPSQKVTIEQLIGHTSGYGDYMQSPGFFDRPQSEQTIQAILEIIKRMPLSFEPGTDWQYSNAGFILLGAIIEQVTGKSYYENVKERIIEPLGMTHTVIDGAKQATPNRAIGYMKTMRGELENNENILLIPTPAGGFIMTGTDLLKFTEAYFFSDKLMTEADKKYDDFYLFLQKLKKGGGAIPVAGGFEGANAVALVDLQRHLVVIVLANMDEPVAEQLSSGVYAVINGKEPAKPDLPPLQGLYKAYHDHGIAYVKQHFNELSGDDRGRQPKDALLNDMGYNLLFSGETDHALEVFKLNTELFPDIANCWDSYGEALLKKGDKVAALKAYKKALTINPNLPSSQQAIKQLENK